MEEGPDMTSGRGTEKAPRGRMAGEMAQNRVGVGHSRPTGGARGVEDGHTAGRRRAPTGWKAGRMEEDTAQSDERSACAQGIRCAGES